MDYSEKVMDHFLNPRNMGEIENADAVGEVGNPQCGDIMRLYLKINDNKIVDAKFKTFGCGAAIASSSMLTELVIGKSIDEALDISNELVEEALGGLPDVKRHCSLLAEQALLSAIENYAKKRGIEIKTRKKRKK
ncbi:MAG: Fe-S cluster assembly scaffold protein NifU [Candidatus Coatesbacteria bacterium 4484_99]|uniref:Fe-S cluster assembly scaffold protein NifU n=1 Tax=Candidatus Coatesbacteria bacterium 4484_99 TaxID=1970774 RepID=A0A1W9S2Y1_9BACT|nr:MAG: Fe-S cluster assembly scaffold protein NifU [Candidatus Coatesbacteria bacterium 4484_99]RLC42391.1 MAG: Fe-S cluster assembly scaffold protein NifU [Candidatus Coatesbacteria bacterium]RLC42740.1 MAG: Fe-S cluster assembly scaffold protein NifU [Candidatus Coatesbacteria bacterium]